MRTMFKIKSKYLLHLITQNNKKKEIKTAFIVCKGSGNTHFKSNNQ